MNSERVKKVLITGGAGFIDSATIKQFSNETDITNINVDISSLEPLASAFDHLYYFFEHADMLDRVESSVLNQSLR